jgi:hypothetical protein
MTDEAIGTKEQRHALRAALIARCSVRATSETRGAAPRLDAAFDALLLALLPSEAFGLPVAALRDFLRISANSREGRVFSDSLQRLRKEGGVQMLANDRERRHWRAQDAAPLQDGAPAVPAPDPHDDVWCYTCGAIIASPCRGPRGATMGPHKRRVSDSLTLRAERQKEQAREAAGAKAATLAARMAGSWLLVLQSLQGLLGSA